MQMFEQSHFASEWPPIPQDRAELSRIANVLWSVDYYRAIPDKHFKLNLQSPLGEREVRDKSPGKYGLVFTL